MTFSYSFYLFFYFFFIFIQVVDLSGLLRNLIFGPGRCNKDWKIENQIVKKKEGQFFIYIILIKIYFPAIYIAL